MSDLRSRWSVVTHIPRNFAHVLPLPKLQRYCHGFIPILLGLGLWIRASDGNDPRLISLYLSVLDKAGKPVSSLAQKDFQVFEDKKLQSIELFSREDKTPISLGVLVDISRSMGREGIAVALYIVKSLASRLKSPDEFFISAFSHESQEVVDFISPEDYLEDPLDHLGTGGRAQTGLAVDLALIKLRDGAKNRKRALLLVSAGLDIAGPATLDHIARFRYPIYALGLKATDGFTGTFDRFKALNLKGSALKVYADQSGGNVVFLDLSSEVDSALDGLVFNLKNQYRLEYLSSNPKRDGKIRKIEVRVSQPEYEVRYLKKYEAPRR